MGQQGPPTTVQPAGPAIQVVEGDGAINSIRLHRAHEPVVRVLGADGEPVSGAAVTFVLPATGPSGNFSDNGLSLTATTDGRGVAVGRGLRPNSIPGQFRIRVNTSVRGAPAVATLVQTNAEPVVRSSRNKKIMIAVLIAAAAAGGAVAASSGKSSNTPSSPGATTGGGSVVAGLPSMGPPR